MKRADFPIFTTYPGLVYLDSAATSQKPQSVIDAVSDVYSRANSNVHRGIYDLSQLATDMFEGARQKVADFVGADDANEIIFTSGTTESINLIAYGWARKNLVRGDIIVTSIMEHHSNLVPWLRLMEEIGIELFYLPIDVNYRLDLTAAKGLDMARVKLIAITQVSNVLGTINPVAEIGEYFRDHGANAKLLVDAAQSLPHMTVNVKQLGADFLVFSSHKMVGPSGVGGLWAKPEVLADMDPMLVGGHMISTVTKDRAEWAGVPDKFEAGTRNIEGVIGLGAAIDYLQAVGMEAVADHELELTAYALSRLLAEKDVTVFGPQDAADRLAVFSFAIGKVHPHDVSEILNRKQVAVRAGHHCAQPLMKRLGVTGTARASMYLYNTKSDVDALIDAIGLVKQTFKV